MYMIQLKLFNGNCVYRWPAIMQLNKKRMWPINAKDMRDTISHFGTFVVYWLNSFVVMLLRSICSTAQVKLWYGRIGRYELQGNNPRYLYSDFVYKTCKWSWQKIYFDSWLSLFFLTLTSHITNIFSFLTNSLFLSLDSNVSHFYVRR